MGPVILIFILVALAASAVAAIVFRSRAQKASAERDAARHQAAGFGQQLQQLNDVAQRYQGIINVEEAIRQLEGQRANLASNLQQRAKEGATRLQEVSAQIAKLETRLGVLSFEEMLSEFGLYEPRFDFNTSEGYKQHLDAIRVRQKSMIKDGSAITCKTSWSVEGSAAKGKAMVNRQLKLMGRAFNGECDAAIAKVKATNFDSVESRIQKSFDAINKLGESQTCSISNLYLELKINELRLFHEYQLKKEREKEEQRQIREQMREEKKAADEIARAQKQAEAEEQRQLKALEKARAEVAQATGAKHAKLQSKLAELEQRLAEAQANSERAKSRAQMTRSGHVYVISNIGSFGEGVFKIGMTRRLEPMDRVKELGDASVPFSFDVHAMMSVNDAPTLEKELHRHFSTRRVNRINERKEFFRVPLQEIATVARKYHAEVEFTMLAKAEEYRQTVAMQSKAKVTRPNGQQSHAAQPPPPPL